MRSEWRSQVLGKWSCIWNDHLIGYLATANENNFSSTRIHLDWKYYESSLHDYNKSTPFGTCWRYFDCIYLILSLETDSKQCHCRFTCNVEFSPNSFNILQSPTLNIDRLSKWIMNIYINIVIATYFQTNKCRCQIQLHRETAVLPILFAFCSPDISN